MIKMENYPILHFSKTNRSKWFLRLSLKSFFSNQNNNFIRFLKLKEIQYIRSKSNQNGTLIMANLEQKNELIQVIEKLQLPEHLSLALDQAHTAEQVILTVGCLQHLSEQWH